MTDKSSLYLAQFPKSSHKWLLLTSPVSYFLPSFPAFVPKMSTHLQAISFFFCFKWPKLSRMPGPQKAHNRYFLNRQLKTLSQNVDGIPLTLSHFLVSQNGGLPWWKTITITENIRSIIFWGNQDMSKLNLLFQRTPQIQGQERGAIGKGLGVWNH